MKNSELLKMLKSDITGTEPFKKEQDDKVATWLSERNGEPYGNEDPKKSQIISRDIRRQEEWQVASIVEPFVSDEDIVNCDPVSADDVQIARDNEIVLNKQFCRGGTSFKRYKFMTKLVKVLYQEGTATIKCGWDYEGETVEEAVQTVVGVEPDGVTPIVQESTIEYERPIRNAPTADVLKGEDVFIDPTVEDDLDKAQFVAIRYESTPSELKQNPRFKNVDKIVLSMKEFGEEPAQREKDSFEFSDNARKKVTVYEYWGNYDLNDDGIAEAIVCSWVGDTIIELKENPYPDKKHPFISLPFSYTPFVHYGEANAELISDSQKTKTAVLRAMINTLAAGSEGQIGVKKGALDPLNKKKFEDGKNFEYNTAQSDIWQGNFNDLPASAFNFYNLMSNEIESITGVKGFTGGIGGSSLGSTATAAQGVLNSTAKREVDIVRNIAENAIIPLLRKWMVYNSEFLEDTEIIRMTGGEFAEVRRDSLSGNLDIKMKISTSEVDNQKAQELAFMLQTLGPTATPEERRMIQAEIARLRKMPALAQKIENFQPQPDPMAEQAKQLELEKMVLDNEKLRAEITERDSRARENEVDIRAKNAKANLDEAKARQLHSTADMQDLDFLNKESGKEDLDKEADHQRKLEQDMVKERAKAINKMAGGGGNG